MLWILLIVAAVVVAWAIGAYNTLIAMKGRTLNAWKQIDVQLKRRHDLIPNLVNAVKGAMEFEKDTLEAVIQARNVALQAHQQATPTGGVQALAQAEAQLGAALSRLNVVVEQYPQLKATTNVGQLQEELTSTENRVAFARQFYNDTATEYNVKQQQFPWSLITGFARAEPVELWEIQEPGDRDLPTVDLSMKPKA
jgi:LemA protein